MEVLKANKAAEKYKKKSKHLQTQLDKAKELNAVLLNTVKLTTSINCICRGDLTIKCLRCISIDALKKSQEGV